MTDEVKTEAKAIAAPTIGFDAFDTTAGAEDGAAMEVRNPATGETLRWPDGRPWVIVYYGADSERVASVARQIADKRSQSFMRTRQAAPAVMVEKDSIELLVTATKAWDIPLSDGTPAKSNANEFRAAYTKYKWLYEQGNEFSGTRANFLKAT